MLSYVGKHSCNITQEKQIYKVSPCHLVTHFPPCIYKCLYIYHVFILHVCRRHKWNWQQTVNKQTNQEKKTSSRIKSLGWEIEFVIVVTVITMCHGALVLKLQKWQEKGLRWNYWKLSWLYIMLLPWLY